MKVHHLCGPGTEGRADRRALTTLSKHTFFTVSFYFKGSARGGSSSLATAAVYVVHYFYS